jgi:hypothetical protein
MDADYDLFEIVKVIRDFWLFDAESYQRQYSTTQRQPLAAGYYVVTWPETIRVRRFNKQASFHGPYKNRQDAQAFLYTMREHKYKLIQPHKRWALSLPNTGSIEEQKVA